MKITTFLSVNNENLGAIARMHRAWGFYEVMLLATLAQSMGILWGQAISNISTEHEDFMMSRY